MSRRIVTLRNGRQETLYGILEEPAGGAAGARFAALLSSPGAKPRPGPHRLYRKLLAPFLERGIPVLRLDFAGIGDSEGAWPDDRLEQIYRRTELGDRADDVRAAFDWLAANCGIGRFIVGGLCGAAMTGLHVAWRDPRLAGLYAIGLPPTVHGARREAAPRVPLRVHRSLYLRKLRAPRAWLRLLSLKSDYRLILGLLAEALHLRRASAASAGDKSAPDDTNPYLAPALLGMLAAGRPALLLYGEHDPLRRVFEERFLEPRWTELEQYRAHFSYAVISGAAHTLAEPSAIGEANRLTGLWLDALLVGEAASVRLDWPSADGLRRAA